MTRDTIRGTIDRAFYDDFLDVEGQSFEVVGINVKHGTCFGPGGREEEVALLEQQLGFRFPSAYVRTVTDTNGTIAAGHFRSGWWKVLDDAADMVLWSFSLSLSGRPAADSPDENTLVIEEAFRAAGVSGVPFGDGFRVDKATLEAVEGWLYFDRADNAPHFADKDFGRTFALAPDFPAMMRQARFAGYDA